MSVVERERVEELVAPEVVIAADVLERAADLLEEFGWCQVEYRQGSKLCYPRSRYEAAPPLCLTGAIWQAEVDFDTGRTDAHELVARVVGVYPQTATIWNDASGRTKAEVVTALRAAAKEART